MKKIIFLCVLCVLCGKIYSQTGTIKEMTGEVTLKPRGVLDFTAAHVGSQIASDTIVSTGFKSTAVITVGSSTLKVRPLTRLTLSEIQELNNEEKLSVSLQTGRVRVEVKPPAGARANVTIQTTTATASVRGTEFELDPQNIYVYEGKVDYHGADGIVIPVGEGASSSVSTTALGSGGGALDPFGLAAGDLIPQPPVGAGISESGVTSIPLTSTEVIFEVNWKK